MGRLWTGLVAALALVACSSAKTGDGGCVAGRSETCACTDGRASAQVCREDGTYGPCACDGRAGVASKDPRADAGAGGTLASDAGAVPAQTYCSTFNDYRSSTTPAEIEVVQAGAFAYRPRCPQVKVGQKVIFRASFTDHPLAPVAAAPANPIPPTTTGTSITVTFKEKGAFGFHCPNHDSMTGAIQVVD